MEQYAEGLLAATREELVRADNKASLLLAAAGVVIGTTMGALLAGAWDPSDLGNGVEWIWWAGVLVALFALYQLASAIYPRTKPAGTTPRLVDFYGDVNAYEGFTQSAWWKLVPPARRPTPNPGPDLKAVLTDSADHKDEQLVDQLKQISRIVKSKYDCIKVALVSLGTATALCAGSVILSKIIS